MIKKISVATAILLASASTAVIACPADGAAKGTSASETNMSKPAMQVGKAGTAEKPAATESGAEKAAKPKA